MLNAHPFNILLSESKSVLSLFSIVPLFIGSWEGGSFERSSLYKKPSIFIGLPITSNEWDSHSISKDNVILPAKTSSIPSLKFSNELFTNYIQRCNNILVTKYHIILFEHEMQIDINFLIFMIWLFSHNIQNDISKEHFFVAQLAQYKWMKIANCHTST